LLALHNKKEAKAKRIILDSRTDHLITHIAKKKTNHKGMYDALVELYQSASLSTKMLLRNKPSVIRMSDTYSGELSGQNHRVERSMGCHRDKVEDKELVPMAFNGFPPSWKPFVQGVCARENLH
jgi:hypothetical protein